MVCRSLTTASSPPPRSRAPRCFPAAFFPTAFASALLGFRSSLSPPRASPPSANAPKHERRVRHRLRRRRLLLIVRGVRALIRVRQHQREGTRERAETRIPGLQLAHSVPVHVRFQASTAASTSPSPSRPSARASPP